MYISFVGTPHERRLATYRLKCRWEENMNMDHMEIAMAM
jgi:hypothetical protein